MLNDFASGILFIFLGVPRGPPRVFRRWVGGCIFTSVVENALTTYPYPITPYTTEVKGLTQLSVCTLLMVRLVSTADTGRRTKGGVGLHYFYQTITNDGPLLHGFGNFLIGGQLVNI